MHQHSEHVKDEEVSARSRTLRLLVLLAGAAFVLIPSSESVHAGLRASLGIGGVQCC